MCFECLKKSWNAYLKNAAPMAAGSFIILLFMVAAVSLSFFLMFNNPQAMLSEEYLDIEISEYMPLGALLLVLSGLFAIALQAGLYGMAIESISRKTSLETMAKVFRKTWKQTTSAFIIIGASYLAVLVMLVAFPAAAFASSSMQYAAIIAGIVAIFILSVLFSLVYPLLASGKGALSSIKSSVSMAKKNFLGIAAVMIFFSLFSLASREILSLIPAAGALIGMAFSTLVIMPWQSVAFSMIYKKLSGKRN